METAVCSTSNAYVSPQTPTGGGVTVLYTTQVRKASNTSLHKADKPPVPPPASDSGIDMESSTVSAPPSTSAGAGDRRSTLDLGVLDLDSMMEDDEYWLYGSKNVSSREAPQADDLLDWLKEADQFEPNKRHSLIQKLEAIARKSSDPSTPTATPVKTVVPPDPKTAPPTLNGLPHPHQNMVVRKSSTESEHSEQYYDAPDHFLTPSQSHETITSPLVSSTPHSRESLKQQQKARKVVVQSPPNPSEVSTPDFVSAEEKMAASLSMPATLSSSGGKGVSPRLMHAELHPDLHDIQLLASMQENDLRNYMEQLQVRRKRQSSSSSDAPAHNTSSDLEQSRHSAGVSRSSTLRGASSRPVAAGHQPSKGSAPTGAFSLSLDRRPKIDTPQTAPPGVRVRKQRRSTETVRDYSTVNSDRLRVQTGGAGTLQKSLPNLVSSRSSDFGVPNGDSKSEKGSVSDIPGRVSPAGSQIQKPSLLRRPTPRRVTGGQVKSGIPLPSKTGIPMPRRAKSPGEKAGPHAVNRVSQKTSALVAAQKQLEQSWSDGCF